MTSDNKGPQRLDPAEISRYARHLTLPEVGREGQVRLREAGVVVVGLGGLGSPAVLYLAAAGVGRIGLVESDRVEESNLQRQLLYGTADVGRDKLPLALARIEAVNPRIRVETHDTRLDPTNAMEILSAYDVVLDATDNFPSRYAINDACALLGKPDVFGSVFRLEGRASVFWAARGPCYRCLYPEPPPAGSVPSCAEAGVLGVLPGIIGTVQAAEAIKLILGRGEPLLGRMLVLDAMEMRFRELRLRKDPDCPGCGEAVAIGAAAEAAQRATGPPLEEPVAPWTEFDLDVVELKRRLDRGERPLLVDVRTPLEWEICRLEGALLIPLQELVSRLYEIDPEREVVLYCHVGVRSALATQILMRHGFGRVRNLAGGIDAWAERVDPSTLRY